MMIASVTMMHSEGSSSCCMSARQASPRLCIVRACLHVHQQRNLPGCKPAKKCLIHSLPAQLQEFSVHKACRHGSPVATACDLRAGCVCASSHTSWIAMTHCAPEPLNDRHLCRSLFSPVRVRAFSTHG
jgi:hypothetical protein